jgi:hypothetical protein
MNGAELLAWLSSFPPRDRDGAIEEYLGIAAPEPSSSSPGDHLVGYHPSGVAAIVRALVEVPVVAEDVVVDVGAGLGKVVLLSRLLTGATARGIELQSALVDRAREAAARRSVDVRFTREDAREADLHDGTVFFLYLPFTGPVLASVVRRLRSVAERRAIVVCALGVDLDTPWLRRRPIDSFWLTIYDSVAPAVPPRPARARPLDVGSAADVIAFERPAERG